MKQLFTLMALVAMSFSLTAQVYFSEDFELGSLPADWAQNTDATDGGFLVGSTAELASPAVSFAGNESNAFIATNDDGCNCDKSDELLYTPLIDLTSAAGSIVYLKFDAFYFAGTYGGITESAEIRVSTDGMNWNSIAPLPSGGWGAGRVIDISEYAGESIHVGFHYNDGGGWLFALGLDNISVEVPEKYDVTFEGVNMRRAAFTGTEVEIGGIIANSGSETITSFDVTWSDGTSSYTDNISGLSIAPLETYEFMHTSNYTIQEGNIPLNFEVTNPNGEVDGSMEDNTLDVDTRGVTPAASRKVVIEEGTGTWCPWCPRGEVFLGIMDDRYPDHFIGIAVHNGDPMTVAAYDDGLGISSFPNMSNERTENFGFGVIEDVENRFFDRVEMAPPAALESAADYDPETGDLTITSKADFLTDASASHRLAVVLIEDGVTGTGSGYAQTNNYAGGGNGPMGGYENLPATVPASQMVYNHVGRILVGGFAGDSESLPEGGEAGKTETHIFETVNIPSDYDLTKMYAVTLLLNGQGHIVNAEKQSLQDVIDNTIVGTNEAFDHSLAEVFPNPFSDVANIRIKLEQAENVNVRIMNSMGQLIAENNYESVVGDMIIPFQAANLANGMYTVHLTIGETLVTKRVMLQK